MDTFFVKNHPMIHAYIKKYSSKIKANFHANDVGVEQNEYIDGNMGNNQGT